MGTEALSGQQIVEAGLDGWTFLQHYGLHGLQTRIHTTGFSDGLKIINAIGQAVEELHHHADLDLRTSRVDVRLVSGYDPRLPRSRGMRADHRRDRRFQLTSQTGGRLLLAVPTVAPWDCVSVR